MAQAETVVMPKRLPLVLGPENRGDSTAYDAKLVNGYVEKNKEGGHWIYQRPCLDEQSRPPAADAAGYGLFNWLGDIYAVFGNTLYKNGVAVVGTVNTTNGVYRFNQCLGATPKMQLGNGVKGYNYDAGAGLVEITDVDFPSSFVKGWAYLNGTTYVMTPSANIQGDDINDPTSWDPLNTILAQIEPDRGMATAKQLVYVVAFKQWTTEIFYDAGNATGSPLGRVEGAKVNWGCISADSIQEIDAALIWLGRTRYGAPEIVLLDNLKAQPISTEPVERLLHSIDMSSVFSWQLSLSGHRFYVITFKLSNLTLVYDMDEQMWSQWTDADGNYLPIVASCVDSNLNTILQHESNGRLYRISEAYSTDAGEEITVDIVTPNFDGGTYRRKNMKVLKLVTDQKAGSVMQVRVNDEDYAPNAWTNFRSIDLSQPNPQLTDCGTFVRRVHNFRYKSLVRMPRIVAAELQIDLGTL